MMKPTSHPGHGGAWGQGKRTIIRDSNLLRNRMDCSSSECNQAISLIDLRQRLSALTNGEDDSGDSESGAECYFSFTKSNTKIAHTPTVMGNCAKEASRSEPPLGRRYVAAIIARAVNTPRRNLLFQFMVSVHPFPFQDFENGSDCTLLFARPRVVSVMA